MAGSLLLAWSAMACSAPGATSPPTAGAPNVPTPSSVTAADAAATVIALDPRFATLGARDPGAIGQGSWYEVTPGASGWLVTLQIGWGDCPAGCIYRHTWQYAVAANGSPALVSETGDPLLASAGAAASPPSVSSASPSVAAPTSPPVQPTPTKRPAPATTPKPTSAGTAGAPIAIPSSGGPWLVGVALAGPVCPVERNPPDPACAPRPVAGAVVVVRDSGGQVVAQAVTAADGTYRAAVPAGSVTVDAQPVAGLMRAPAPVSAVVPSGPAAWVRVDLAYDTGIR